MAQCRALGDQCLHKPLPIDTKSFLANHLPYTCQLLSNFMAYSRQLSSIERQIALDMQDTGLVSAFAFDAIPGVEDLGTFGPIRPLRSTLLKIEVRQTQMN